MAIDEKRSRLQRVRGSLYNLAMMLTSDQEVSYHLLQDTLSEAMDQAIDYSDESVCRKSLLKIMRNLYVREYRCTDAIKPTIEISVSDGSMHSAAFEISHVHNGIQTLPLDQRNVFGLYATGYMNGEIASKLEMPVGAVQSHIFSASRNMECYLAHA